MVRNIPLTERDKVLLQVLFERTLPSHQVITRQEQQELERLQEAGLISLHQTSFEKRSSWHVTKEGRAALGIRNCRERRRDKLRLKRQDEPN